MKKRNILIISLTIIILLIAYFGYKAFNLKYYTINNINNPNQYKNMKIRNDFKDYSKMEDSAKNSSTKLVLKDENNKTIKAFWMGITDTYVYLLKNDKTLFGTDDSRITNTDLNNDIGLFNYLSKQKNIKNNLFTSIKKMKENYAIEYMTSVVMPTIDNITLINGDYEGYIFNIKSNTKEVSILKDNKRYAFIFIDKNNLTDEYLKSILSTIVID